MIKMVEMRGLHLQGYPSAIVDLLPSTELGDGSNQVNEGAWLWLRGLNLPGFSSALGRVTVRRKNCIYERGTRDLIFMEYTDIYGLTSEGWN